MSWQAAGAGPGGTGGGPSGDLFASVEGNVRELVASAADWSEEVTDDPEAGIPLERFLAEAALLSSAETVIGNDEGVTLMTLHTAKGLEWPVVVLTGMEHGLFPLARSEEQPDGLEEERRLCYVGLTRAKDKLYLTWARARRRGGELQLRLVEGSGVFAGESVQRRLDALATALGLTATVEVAAG